MDLYENYCYLKKNLIPSDTLFFLVQDPTLLTVAIGLSDPWIAFATRFAKLLSHRADTESETAWKYSVVGRGFDRHLLRHIYTTIIF